MDSRQKTYPKPRVFLAALAVALITIAPAASAPSAPQISLGRRRWCRPFRSSRSSRGIPFQGQTSTTSSSPRTPPSTRLCTRCSGRRTPAPPPTRRRRTARIGGACRRWTPTAIRRRGRSRARSRSSGPTRPSLTSPDDAATISFPDEPLVLRWDPVPGAAKYSVEIASDRGSQLARDLRRQSGGHSGDEPRSRHSSFLEYVLLGGDAPRRQGQPRRTIRSPFIHLGLALDDHAGRRQTSRTKPSSTIRIHLGSCSRCGALRSRGQLLVRLRVRIEGLLHRQADRNETDPSEVFVNNTYYWRVRAINARTRRCRWLERRPVLRRRPSTTTRP